MSMQHRRRFVPGPSPSGSLCPPRARPWCRAAADCCPRGPGKSTTARPAQCPPPSPTAAAIAATIISITRDANRTSTHTCFRASCSTSGQILTLDRGGFSFFQRTLRLLSRPKTGQGWGGIGRDAVPRRRGGHARFPRYHQDRGGIQRASWTRLSDVTRKGPGSYGWKHHRLRISSVIGAPGRLLPSHQDPPRRLPCPLL